MASTDPPAAPPAEEGLAFLTADEVEAGGMDAGVDDTLPAGSLGSMQTGGELFRNSFICQASHPSVAFFHMAFKLAAILVQVFCGLFTDGFVTPFVVIILLLAADFWVVKNVSGRLLVGLRWWNKIAEDGTTSWVYESHPDAEKTVPPMNKRIFWGAMYAAILGWGVLSLMHGITFTLDWLVVDGTALALVGANLMGYVRCSQEADKRRAASAGGLGSVLTPGSLAGAATFASLPGVLPAITTGLAGSLFGTTAAPAAATAGATAPSSGMQGDATGATVV